MQGEDLPKTRVISENIAHEINKLKQDGNQDILMMGSPTAVHALLENNLIDEYLLFFNPVLLGNGLPRFASVKDITNFAESALSGAGYSTTNYRCSPYSPSGWSWWSRPIMRRSKKQLCVKVMLGRL